MNSSFYLFICVLKYLFATVICRYQSETRACEDKTLLMTSKLAEISTQEAFLKKKMQSHVCCLFSHDFIKDALTEVETPSQ